ncbi:hypothetical protein pb186bvf_000253 [Paramecium bursaria]
MSYEEVKFARINQMDIYIIFDAKCQYNLKIYIQKFILQNKNTSRLDLTTFQSKMTKAYQPQNIQNYLIQIKLA